MNKSEWAGATYSLLAQYNPFQGWTNYNKAAIRLVTDNFQGVSENNILYHYFIKYYFILLFYIALVGFPYLYLTLLLYLISAFNHKHSLPCFEFPLHIHRFHSAIIRVIAYQAVYCDNEKVNALFYIYTLHKLLPLFLRNSILIVTNQKQIKT